MSAATVLCGASLLRGWNIQVSRYLVTVRKILSSELLFRNLPRNHSKYSNVLIFMQEHTAHFITRLLSPPVPAEYSGSESHLIRYAPILNVLIVGIATVDCVQIFSLHGLVSELPDY